nr:NADH dehydrogenase subunit 3 [Systasis sp. 1 HHL-2023a]
MYMYMLMILIILMILMLMMLINFILSKKMFKNREKMSSFECGFESISMSRMPFSLQFYLISIIFLIFDVEISMIFPMLNSYTFMFFYLYVNYCIIIVILIIGLYFEWIEGALKWFK